VNGRGRVTFGLVAVLVAVGAAGGGLYVSVVRPAMEVSQHKRAIEEATETARAKRHSLPSDAELFEFKSHVDALVELGHYEERVFRLTMTRARSAPRQLFPQLEELAEGLPVWDWKPTLDKDAIEITVRAKPSDMDEWAEIIGVEGTRIE
jgi:hypothetical protein